MIKTFPNTLILKDSKRQSNKIHNILRLVKFSFFYFFLENSPFAGMHAHKKKKKKKKKKTQLLFGVYLINESGEANQNDIS